MKKKNEIEDYRIDESKFLLAINEGHVFKTSYGEVKRYRQGGSVYFRQSFTYMFNNEFIINNRKKLIDLGIMIKKENNK